MNKNRIVKNKKYSVRRILHNGGQVDRNVGKQYDVQKTSADIRCGYIQKCQRAKHERTAEAAGQSLQKRICEYPGVRAPEGFSKFIEPGVERGIHNRMMRIQKIRGIRSPVRALKRLHSGNIILDH